MKKISILLTAVGALIVMAFAGTSSASANHTVLCTDGTTQSPCPSGEEPYTGDIVFELVSSTATFTTGSGTITCNESSGSGSVVDSGASSGTPDGTLDMIDWTNNGSQNCPTTLPFNPTAASSQLSDPWGVEAELTGGGPGDGIVTLTGVHALIHVNIFGGIDCEYKGDSDGQLDEKVVGDAYNADSTTPTGSGDAEVEFDAEPLSKVAGGSSCPNSGVFDAVYAMTGSNGEDLYLR